MIFGTLKVASKVTTVLWVVSTAHKVYKGYKKTEPAIKATNKVLKAVKGVTNFASKGKK